MWHRPCKTVEHRSSDVWVMNGMGSRNHVLDGSENWRHLTNTVERLCAAAMSGSVTSGGNAACSQITSASFITIDSRMFLRSVPHVQNLNMNFSCIFSAPDFNEQLSHTNVIQAHYVFLVETLDVKFSGLVDRLYLDKVVSAEQVDDIVAEQTSFRASEKLLSVISRKSPQQFQLFLDALDKCGQQHVRNVITGQQGLSIYLVIALRRR